MNEFVFCCRGDLREGGSGYGQVREDGLGSKVGADHVGIEVTRSKLTDQAPGGNNS